MDNTFELRVTISKEKCPRLWHDLNAIQQKNRTSRIRTLALEGVISLGSTETISLKKVKKNIVNISSHHDDTHESNPDIGSCLGKMMDSYDDE